MLCELALKAVTFSNFLIFMPLSLKLLSTLLSNRNENIANQLVSKHYSQVQISSFIRL